MGCSAVLAFEARTNRVVTAEEGQHAEVFLNRAKLQTPPALERPEFAEVFVNAQHRPTG